MMTIVDDESFLLYAAKYYDNPQCQDIEEFHDDLKRFKYLKRLFGKYAESGELRERLILNHLIILYNVFGNAATRMLFFKLKDHLQYLKPFLLLMGQMPDRVISADGHLYISSDIPMDQAIVETLRGI
jgi:hypothetical protein